MTSMRLLRRIIRMLFLAVPCGILLSMALIKKDSEFPSAYLATKPEYHFLLEDLEKNGQEKISAEKIFSGNASDDDWVQSDGIILSDLLALKVDPTIWSAAQIRDLSQYILITTLRYHVKPSLLLSLIDVESEFRPGAVSSQGAIGLMQVMPATAAAFLGESVTEAMLHDPKKNIEVGLSYLVELRRRFKKPEYYLTAYNIGPSELMRRMQNHEGIPVQYYQKILRKVPLFQKPQEKVMAGQWTRRWL